MYKRDEQAHKNKNSTFNSKRWGAGMSVFCVDLRALRMLVSFQFANTRQERSIYRTLANRGAVFKVRGPIYLFWSVVRGDCGVVDFKSCLPGANSMFLNTATTHQSFFFNSLTNEKGISNTKFTNMDMHVNMHSTIVIFASFIYFKSLSVLSLRLFRTFL